MLFLLIWQPKATGKPKPPSGSRIHEQRKREEEELLMIITAVLPLLEEDW